MLRFSPTILPIRRTFHATRFLSSSSGKFPDVVIVKDRDYQSLKFKKMPMWSVLDQKTFSEIDRVHFYLLAAKKSVLEDRPSYVVVGEHVAINISDGYSRADDSSFYLDFQNISFKSFENAFNDSSFELVQISPGRVEEIIKKSKIDSAIFDVQKAEMSLLARSTKEDIKKGLDILDHHLESERRRLEGPTSAGAKLLIQIPSIGTFPAAINIEDHYREDTGKKGLKQSVVSPYGQFSMTLNREVLPDQSSFMTDVNNAFGEIYSLLNKDPYSLGMDEVVDIFSQHMRYASFEYKKLN